LSKNVNFDKRQRSRYKKFVATYPNGDKVQAETQQELTDLMKEYKKDNPEESTEESTEEPDTTPKFDPITGEPL